MKRAFTFSFLLILITTAATTLAANPPYTGYVTGDDVYIRSGPAQSYYQLGKADKGTLLEVDSILHNWAVIKPPAWAYSLISKDYVTSEDGKTGVVTGDRVRVRAPSPKSANPTDSYKVQVKLDTGDKVKILGEDGASYKIAPPPGVMLYIHSDFVREATVMEIAAANAAPAADLPEQTDPEPAVTTTVVEVETPVVETATEADEPEVDTSIGPDAGVELSSTTAVVEAEGSTPTVAETETSIAVIAEAENTESTSVADTPAAEVVESIEEPQPNPSRILDQKLTELEARFAELSAKPLGEQQPGALLAAYEALAANEAVTDEQKIVVDTRIELLQGRIELKSAMASLEAQKKALAEKRADLPYSYDAVGKLMISTLYDGERLPLLYRMVDPMSGLTVGYVEPNAKVELVDVLGQTVGVVGEKRYDESLRLNIIKPKRVVPLSGSGS